MIFKYNEYKTFLNKLISKGKCVKFSEWDGNNSFLLRFDVDFDLNAALKIAKINQEIKVPCTFFILTTCHFYNILSQPNRDLLKAISDTGAEIGLHFDPTIYPETKEDELIEKVNNEAAILQSIINKDIKSISLHNPSVHNQYPLFEGYINAYDPKFFNDNTYISDSRMGFRGKNIFEFINNIGDSSVQITLHPMHYNDIELSYTEIMFNHVVNYINKIDDNFKVNSTYLKQTAPSLIKNFKKLV